VAISRRNFFRTLGAGAAAGTVLSWPLSGKATSLIFEPFRPQASDGVVYLDSNENAYGPSEKTRDAIRAAVDSANRYPYRQYDGLTEQIAAMQKVKVEQVVLGCGSTEILRVAAQARLGRGKTLLQAAPTFEALAHYASTTGADIISVPLAHDYSHDLPAMLARMNQNKSIALAYLCNPNNPTGSITPRSQIEEFIAKCPASTMVLVDEAYHHFAGQTGAYASFLDKPMADERVVVARTFSKVYGMAGLRLGYAVAAAKTAASLRTFLTMDSVNGMVTAAARAALHDQESVEESVRRNQDDRQEFYNQCHARMLKPIDSHANFVMMDAHRPAVEVIAYFEKRNVRIGRRFPPMDRHVRISLGRPPDMAAFWRVWDTLPHVDMNM